METVAAMAIVAAMETAVEVTNQGTETEALLKNESTLEVEATGVTTKEMTEEKTEETDETIEEEDQKTESLYS